MSFWNYLSGSTSVWTTETRLIPDSLLPSGVNFCEIAVRTASTNTWIVYVGKTGLTAGIATPATDGFPFTPDQWKIYKITTPQRLYTRASAASQVIHWEIKYT